MKKRVLLEYRNESAYCTVESMDEVGIVLISGNAELPHNQIALLDQILCQEATNLDSVTRYVFAYPTLTSDFAFALSGMLTISPDKAVFLVHPSVKNVMELRPFWYVLSSETYGFDFIEAINLIGRPNAAEEPYQSYEDMQPRHIEPLSSSANHRDWYELFD